MIDINRFDTDYKKLMSIFTCWIRFPGPLEGTGYKLKWMMSQCSIVEEVIQVGT